MKVFIKIIKAFFAILFLIGIFGFGKSILSGLRAASDYPTQFLALIAGGMIFFVLWILYFSRRRGFWGTLEHELTHALFALLFFKRIHTISASRKKGGIISMEGGNVVIALAPYFFPLAAMTILLLKPFILYPFQIYLNFLVGFTYLFHLFNLFREFHPGQPDLKNSGFFFSIVMVAFLNIFFLGIILAALPGKWVNIQSFLNSGFSESYSMLIFLFQSAKTVI